MTKLMMDLRALVLEPCGWNRWWRLLLTEQSMQAIGIWLFGPNLGNDHFHMKYLKFRLRVLRPRSGQRSKSGR